MKETKVDTNKIYKFETGDLIYHVRAEEYFIVISDPYYPKQGIDWLESGLIRRDVIRVMNMQTSHMGQMGFNACELCGRIENESNKRRNDCQDKNQQ